MRAINGTRHDLTGAGVSAATQLSAATPFQPGTAGGAVTLPLA